MNVSKSHVLPLIFAAFLIPASVDAAKAGSEDTPRKPVTVTSDMMEANTGENKVVFKGNVEAVEDFTLCSDELNIIYDENKDVSRIEATGNVRIFQDQKTSTSGRAVYNRKDRVIVLTESPQVKQCSDIVKGERITVYLDKDNALVESGDGGRVKAVIMPNKDCPENKAPERPIGEQAARCKGTR
ncbi:MAG TPA: lipopolysaccharide transport periplasmic protein LptA [Deltaproteobacteria bacterium]|nr:MAG: lipopolysaccharide transport periplasmic protein LptA [Deltaproteobacteria bacterium GWA2_55_82]OGQ62218.1 MAG: lipopolysaccharide transport periplasmic protein LptA [Deltaproteobacteria bacterium RIFCSPLOWO2_02_FULL_55_12]OIJ73260.1 MAG: lipopolysaccharide transport periplasmic protein LptA [Deltaproteobacteria bacterium GWC2_55_46]HBG45476.1 lipopolysaccharide transport periplasmic protein LptA [Deltaproteobacteria bacterium]HCY10307.1 lipopolysaccharide transport periplasmic protein 